MSETVKLTAKDGNELDAYVAKPEGEPIAGLVVIQEIFGVNQQIRNVADSYAKQGFLVAAPAIFDRFEKNVDLGYEGDDLKKAYELYQKLDPAKAAEDVAAAIEYLRAQTGKKVGTVGFCFGGLVSWLSATRLKSDASVGYYPGGIGNFAEEMPTAPVLLNFGGNDSHIPKEQGEKVKAHHPEVEVFWYEGAEHAFANAMRASYKPDAATLAGERSLAFLKKNLAAA
jgi:carboxymethylenebutenolidase